ncbi:hypothetical protein ACFL6S_18455 [Candidatus Poribacteria bacterium]
MIKRILVKLICALVIILVLGFVSFVYNLDQLGQGNMGIGEVFRHSLVDGLDKGFQMSWDFTITLGGLVQQRALGTIMVNATALLFVWAFVFCIVSIPFDVFYAETGAVKPFLIPALIALFIVIGGGAWIASAPAAVNTATNLTSNLTQNLTEVVP